MKKKERMKRIWAVALVALLIVSLAACGGKSKGGAAPAPAGPEASGASAGASAETEGASDAGADSDIVVVGDEVYNVVFNSIVNDMSTVGDAGYYATKWFFEEIGRRTEGHITFEDNYSSALFKTAEILDALSGGALDMALTTTHSYGDIIPEGFLSNIPGWAASPFDAHETLRSTDLWDIYDEAFRENGIIPTHFIIIGDYGFVSKTPIYTMADFKGKLIRASGGMFTVWYDSLGFSSVNITISDTYDAIQKGTIDIDSFGFAGIRSFKVGEIAKYFVYPAFHQANCMTHMFSEKFWNTLPPEYQQLILEVGEEAEHRASECSDRDQPVKLKEVVAEYDMNQCDFEEMDALIESMDVIHETWSGMNERCRQMSEILQQHIANRGI